MVAASGYEDRKRAELVFIPSPGVGHLRSTVELAKLLVNRDRRLSVAVLTLPLPVTNDHHTTSSYLSSLSLSDPTRVRFVHLPNPVELTQPSPPQPHGAAAVPHDPNSETSPPKNFLASFIESHKTQVHDAVVRIIADGSDSVRIAGLVVDMFCAPMIDVANQLGVPSYVFFTSGASPLGLILNLPKLLDELDQAATCPESDSKALVSIPSYANPIPCKMLPALMMDRASGGRNFISDMAEWFKQAQGIMVNSFPELESFAFQCLTTSSPAIPPVYPVGPIISDGGGADSGGRSAEIAEWLDGQLDSSVVFLCFGSMGSFDEGQVREISVALERCGRPFLWALRRPLPEGKPFELPGEFDDPGEGLPEGFLGRTAGRGKVIGWAPQMEVLSHAALGGFVSHCGWNSTLESLWCGVPVATWPMQAEQPMNAFLLTRELGLGVVLTLDYKVDMRSVPNMVVPADVIEEGIARVMAREDRQLAKVREMKQKAKKAVAEGGSSYHALGCFVDDVLNDVE